MKTSPMHEIVWCIRAAGELFCHESRPPLLRRWESGSACRFVARTVFLLIIATPGLAQKPAGTEGAVNNTSVTDATPRRVPAAAKVQELLARAEADMKAGRAVEALVLLEPHEDELVGDKRYDYLLGIAALDSGKADKATLAFERVLAVDPNFAGARLDMARAYFQLGDFQRAKTEFTTVLTQNPPPEARRTTEQYLKLIAAREEAQKTRFAAYVEAGGGRDSNINSSPGQSQIPVPIFANQIFTLSQNNVQTGANYAQVAAGAEVNRTIDGGLSAFAGFDVRQRVYDSYSRFNTVYVRGQLGAMYTSETDVLRAGVSEDQYNLGGPAVYTSAGVNGEWRHALSKANQITVSGQSNRFRFPAESLQTQNFDQSIVGIGGMHFMPDGKSALLASLYGGYERSVAPVTALNPTGGRADGNKRFNGVRLGGQGYINDNWDFFVGAGYQAGRYDKQNASFLEIRRDPQTDFSAGVNWRFARQWSLRPQVTFVRNDSNIAIYSFRRVDASINLRRDF